MSETSRQAAAPGRAGFLSRFLSREHSPRPMGLLLFFAFVTLTLMVSLPALVSVERNESTLTRLLADKGFALVSAIENVIRGGVRAKAGVRLQSLLEQMAQSGDVNFIAVTMPDGTIVADSSRDRIGEILTIDGKEATEAAMHQLSPSGERRWSIMDMEGTRSFVVYCSFQPDFPSSFRRRHPDLPVPMIFLGMDISPFEIISAQNRAYVMMLAGVTLLVGLACLLVLYHTQKARQSRLREKEATSRVAVLEEEVRRKEKLAAVGNLAAGVAHEIRNPLSSIKGYATYFEQRFPEGSDDREAAAVMVREADRLNKVITELIGLSRPTDVSLAPTSLGEVARHVARLLSQDAAHRGVELVLDLPEGMPKAMADADRLSQAVLNLCLNGLDAMPGGGRLTVSLSKEPGRVLLAVADTGTGISRENLVHIFDPYFTTKARGTGIGLATVHKIVEAMNGDISVASEAGEEGRPGWTRFLIGLPAAKGGPDGARTLDRRQDTA